MKEYYIIKLGDKQFCLDKIHLMAVDAGLYFFSYKRGYKLGLGYKILAKIKCKQNV